MTYEYFTLDFLLRNEVVLPTLIGFFTFAYATRNQTRAENEENFITLKHEFRELWSQIAVNKTLKASHYDDCTDEQKFQVFAIIDFLCQVHFLHGKSSNRFAKQWHENMNHVFRHKLMVTGFTHITTQREQPYNQEWIEHVNNIIRYNMGKVPDANIPPVITA